MTGPEGPGHSQEPTPLSGRETKKKRKPRKPRSQRAIKREQVRHAGDMQRFLTKQLADLGQAHKTQTGSILDTPPSRPHLRIVDDAYHRQQELRKRLGKGKGLTRWLRDREKKKEGPETPPDKPQP